MSHNSTHPDQTADVSVIVSSAIRDAKLALSKDGLGMSRRDLLFTAHEIKNLLADTYAHLNAHAPPNKLPHELLVMIFQHILPSTTISFPAIENDGYRPALRALKVIAQVCRLWRDVAFGTPSFWTRIDARAYPADELRHLVQRSDPLLLSVFLDNIAEGTALENAMFLGSSSPRLYRLDLDIKIPTPSVIKELLSFNGSTLRCLTASSAIQGRPRINRDHLTHTIPILQGQTHSLEALAVVPSVGWVPANHFPCLTHLYISFDTKATEALDTENILFLLRNTPRLEIAHFHHLDALEDLHSNEPLRAVELPRLRSLVFTVSAYHSVIGVLHGLSLPSSALIRLDDIFVSFNSDNLGPIPGDLGPLHDVTGMKLAVDNDEMFLVVEGTSSGLWLNMCHEEMVDRLQDLRHMLPLRNLVSLHADVHEPIFSSILCDMLQLSEFSVRLTEDQAWLGRGGPPLILSLCTLLSRSQPVACPSLRSLAIEWPRNMPMSKDLGVSYIIAMLAKRSQLGHPIRRLVVQAIPVQFGTTRPTHFSEQLSPLAEHVEEYEECVDGDTHVCSFEVRDMWNVEGAEDYWAMDEEQRPRYPELRSFDCSEGYDGGF